VRLVGDAPDRRLDGGNAALGNDPDVVVSTIVAASPAWPGKRSAIRSWAFWDSIPGTVKSSTYWPPIDVPTPMAATTSSRRMAIDQPGRRVVAEARFRSRGAMPPGQ